MQKTTEKPERSRHTRRKARSFRKKTPPQTQVNDRQTMSLRRSETQSVFWCQIGHLSRGFINEETMKTSLLIPRRPYPWNSHMLMARVVSRSETESITGHGFLTAKRCSSLVPLEELLGASASLSYTEGDYPRALGPIIYSSGSFLMASGGRGIGRALEPHRESEFSSMVVVTPNLTFHWVPSSLKTKAIVDRFRRVFCQGQKYTFPGVCF